MAKGQSNYLATRNSGLSPITFSRRDNGLNQYSNWTPSIITYDDNYYGSAGNGVMMQEGWITASYNALNQPIAIWSPNMPSGAFTWFGYDPLGRCVKRWVSASGGVYSNPATYFHYDGWNMLQEGNNAWGPARVYMHGGRMDEIVSSYNTATGGYAFHHYDARGHCTLLTDSYGNIMEQYEYDAFGLAYFYDAGGNPTIVNGQLNSVFGNRFLFTGRELLSDLHLYDFRNRMYQPELGRFLQPDSKEFGAGDYNLYSYCHNDPVNHSDPFGLKDEYDYPNPNDAAAARHFLDRLEAMGGEIASRVRQIRESQNVIRFIPIQKDQSGWEKYNLPPRAKGDTTNRTTPDDEKASRGGRPGTGSKVELDPNNSRDPAGNKRDPVEASGHEVDHAAANDQGRRLQGPAEENRAREFQKLIRKKLHDGG